tara:strand:+ start:589 stop:1197 length:609 start_codon:yes stop_codon:yes gene_type:complete
MKKSSPAKGKYLNAMIGVAKAYAGSKSKTKDPGTAVEETGGGGLDLFKEGSKNALFNAKLKHDNAPVIPAIRPIKYSSKANAVSTTPAKHSPYKMAGMSWKDGQDPMSGKAAGKPSPAKEPMTAVIIGGMVLGAVMDGISGSKQAKAQEEMFNAEGKYNADVKNRELETLAQDKKSKAIEGFADRASRKSEIYASAAANTKF